MLNQPVHPIVPLLQLLHVLGRIGGRKKLQKIVHILQERGVPFPERFQYAYYGMYSQQLRSEVERLESENLVKESPVYGMNVSYALEKTSELEALVTEIAQEQEPVWAETARKLNALAPQELEGVSTILFLQGAGFSGAALKQRLLGLKPHLESVYNRCEKEATALPDFKSAVTVA
jgi:uncharacterized protein YwgA